MTVLVCVYCSTWYSNFDESSLPLTIQFPQEASSLPVPPPPPRPVINFTNNLRSPHHAGCEENTFTNTHVPFIATARATPGT